MTQSAGGRILIVDDEEMVLTALSSLLTLENEYEVITFTRAGDALKYLEAEDVDLLISDFLMPEMDGLQLLKRARELRPEVPRIILTGYADKENAIKAINEVGLYQYIEKPWSNADLEIVIRNGIEKRRLVRSLGEKIAQIDRAYSELQSIQDDILKAFV